jgi:hypothetical protein
MFGFQVDKIISESMLLRKWPKNISHAKNNAYETLIIVYNRKLDVLVPNSYITISDVEEEIYPPYLEDVIYFV